MHKIIFYSLPVLFLSNLFAQPEIIDRGMSYDDVLLVPQYSPVSSRQQVLLHTQLTKNIRLKIPLVSANMDTVTESGMAIMLAQLGGIGIIHRFNTIEQQVAEVQKVKRYRNAVIENPFTCNHDNTVQEAKNIMHEHGITGLLVTGNDTTLVGILTSRDIRFRSCDQTLVSELMTPREHLIVAHKGISSDDAQKILMEHRIEKLPLVTNDWHIAGLITAKDILRKTQYPQSSIDQKDRLLVGAAIGVKEDALERAHALIAAGVDVLVIDIAHGHSEVALETLRNIKTRFPTIDVIAGNVATAQGTRALIEAGADAIKVGVGPGSICTTRITTGSGYPQLSAIVHCAQEAEKYGVPIIADGGIKFSGDITKAIAAGASTVMIGSLLAGTDESPGLPLIKRGKKYKVVRGMASYGAQLGRQAKIDNQDGITHFVPEGVEALIPYRGEVREVIYQLLGGLRSGMSYCGVYNLDALRGNGQFVQITTAGMRESGVHDVEELG